MLLVDCPSCGARNRAELPYCMRCGKPLGRPDTPAAAHARAFVERERGGPFLGAFPQALDFSPNSLAYLDAFISEMWGDTGEAPGDGNWQPSAGKLQVVINFGAYLGEVLCRALPAYWEMNPAQPESVIAARVVDRQGRRINTFAQVGVRLRDGAGVGLDSLYAALTGRAPRRVALPLPTAPQAPVAATPAPPRPPAPPLREDPATLLREAEALAASGDTAAAVERYRRVVALAPADVDARRQLAIGLSLNGATDEALRQLDELKRLRPQDPQVADTRAVVLAQAGRFDEAIGTLDMALMRQPAELSLRRRRGFIRLKAGPPARAQADLDAALAADPDDAELLLGLAHCHEQQNQPDTARAYLQRVLTLAPERCPPALAAAAGQRLHPSPADVARIYEQGVSHARAGRFDAALPLFMEAARLDPNHAGYLRDVGNCLFDLGRVEEARDWLLRCLRVEPTLSGALWLFGRIEAQLGRPQAAAECYRRILANPDADPRNVERARQGLRALGAAL